MWSDLRALGEGAPVAPTRHNVSISIGPPVLVFGGSGGGLMTSVAALLAARGYPSLALAYFKAPGLPQTLHNIPLEYFAKALRVLRAQPGVDPDHVLVVGESRGGEAALLLSAYFPRLVNGVIAGVPSSVVNSAAGPDTGRPAWTLGGRPLPAVSPSEFGRPTRPKRQGRSSRWSASVGRSCSPAVSRI